MQSSYNKYYYTYIWKTMEKDKNKLKKLKKEKENDFIFNYLQEGITPHDLDYINTHFNNVKKYSQLTHEKSNYSKGILPSFVKMAHLTYYKNEINKSFFDVNVLFFNEEMLIIKQNESLFINFRGTVSYKQIELLQDLSVYKTQFFLPDHIYQDFMEWKHKLMKKYSIENVLDKKYISDRFLFHKGFLELYNAYKIKKKVLKILEKYTNDINTIFLNGHSMGGAFANICALDIYEFYEKKDLLKKINVNIITFGTPGNMNSNLSLFFYYLIQKKFIGKYILVVNKKDIILSSLTDKTYFLSKFFGILRHSNASIPTKNKNIIMNNDQKCFSKFMIVDTQKYLNTFFDIHDIPLQDIHSLFCFSGSKNAVCFSI